MFRKLLIAVAAGLVPSAVMTVTPQALAGDEPPSRIVLADAARDVWGAESGDEEPTKIGAYPPADVRRAVVNHRPRSLVVRMRFADLRRVGEQLYFVEIRTPDNWFSALVISEPGARRGSHHLETGDERGCRAFNHTIDYTNDVVRMRIARKCLENPDWVRVGLINYLAIGGSLFGEDWDEIYFDNPHNTRRWSGYTPRLYRG